MSVFNQLNLADQFFHPELRKTKTAEFLSKMNTVIDWNRLVAIVRVIDKTSPQHGGRPRHNSTLMIKAIFLQHFYGLSDPQLEEQLQDRYSFQQFVGMSSAGKAPDFTSIWRFKDELTKADLGEKLFHEINAQLDEQGLFVRKGSILDATIIESANRPLSKKARQDPRVLDSKQIDTDAHSTKKTGVYYFGYKGHISLDWGSNLIYNRLFTSANVADGPQVESLVDMEAHAIFGDKAYADNRLKKMARDFGWYYGILDKKPKNGCLSNKQKKRNKRLSRIRAHVEHPFAWMKTQSKGLHARARSGIKNAISFDFSCMCWNLKQASLLLVKAA